MKIGETHKIYGKVVAMGIKDGEPYRFFKDKQGCISLIPLSCIELGGKSDGKNIS